jgi:hypothetical protein
MIGMANWLSTSREAMTLRSPICIEPTGEPGDQTPGIRPQGHHRLQQRGNRGLGEAAGIVAGAAQRARGQQDMRQSPDPGRRIVQHDRDAAPQSQRHQHGIVPPRPEFGYADQDLVRHQATRR